MQLTSLFITAAGLAVTTNAFLLPPEVSEHDNDIVDALAAPIKAVPMAEAKRQSLNLNCPGCPMRVAHHALDGDAPFTTEIPSHLKLDFSIETSDGVDRLLLNNYELYPHADPFRNTLAAPLVPELKKHKKPQPAVGRPTTHQPLGFGLRTHPVETSADDMLALIQVDIQIIEVGNTFVNGIQNVEAHLVKLPGGELMIAKIEATDSETMQETPAAEQEECTTMFCKWRAEFMAHMSAMSHMRHGNCGGHHESHHAHHDHHDHHGHMYAGNKDTPPNILGDENTHSWGQLFKNIGSHILLPIAIGIMAGVTASIFGMLLGTVIVFLWRNVARRGGSRRRRGHAHKAATNERAVPAEKAGLMAHQECEAPPSYAEEGLVDVTDTKREPETEA